MTVIEIKGDIIHDDSQWLYDELEWQGTSPGKVSAGLALANGGPVDVVINSHGGSVYMGSEIYTMLRSHPGDVTVKIVGIAASAASVIAMAGNKVIISPTAQIMIHNASIITEGDNRDHAAAADFLNNVNESVAAAYEAKTGIDRTEIRAMMDAETFFTAEMAKEKGFADEIMFANEAPANGAELAASAAAHSIPYAAIRKMKELAASAKLPVTAAKKTEEDVNIYEPKAKKEEKENMDLQTLKNEHGDLYNEIVKDVQNAERERIAGLNELSAHQGSKDVIAAAIKDGRDAGAVALEILKASAERTEKAGESRKKDAANSNVTDVKADEAPFKEAGLLDKEKEEAELEAQAKANADFINSKRGVK